MLDITRGYQPPEEEETKGFISRMGFKLTPQQVKANLMLGGAHMHTCLVGGSRSGKTSIIVRKIIQRGLSAPGSRHLICRFRANAVRASVLADTFPKVMRSAFPGVLWHKKSEGYVEVMIDPDEGLSFQVWFGGLDDAERIEKILGMEFATIFPGECSQIPYSSIQVLRTRLAQPGTGLKLRGFYDLNPTTKAHWTNVEFGEHRDPVTGMALEDPENFQRMFLNPGDNAANLDPEYLKMLSRMPKAYRERFFEGKYIDAIEGALWSVDLLELCREDPIEPDPRGKKLYDVERIAVGVDPSGAQSKGDKKSADIGIVVAGKRRSNSVVILEDATMQGSPREWGRAVVAAFKRWGADIIVAEANYGGAMVESTIHAVDPNVPVKMVNASRGKVLRAEPVAALYEHDEDSLPRVTHAGRFDKLEDQLCLFSREGYKGEKSPDRADAMVWAVTELMLSDDKYNGYTLAHVR